MDGKSQDSSPTLPILVTGGNNGIGFELCRQLAEMGVSVLLCARSEAKGETAVKDIKARYPKATIQSVILDVTNEGSVVNAAKELAGQQLYAIVNNAGVMSGGSSVILDTNFQGTVRVCEAFMPLLAKDGRVVNVSSASGPMFITKQPKKVQNVLCSRDVTLKQIKECAKELAAGPGTYGLSKACINAYTLVLAKKFPHFMINSCTPGYIATGLTGGRGNPVSKGTVAIKYLLFNDLNGNGRYYGSDAVRSPLDRYRDPGTPGYASDGDDNDKGSQ